MIEYEASKEMTDIPSLPRLRRGRDVPMKVKRASGVMTPVFYFFVNWFSDPGSFITGSSDTGSFFSFCSGWMLR